MTFTLTTLRWRYFGLAVGMLVALLRSPDSWIVNGPFDTLIWAGLGFFGGWLAEVAARGGVTTSAETRRPRGTSRYQFRLLTLLLLLTVGPLIITLFYFAMVDGREAARKPAKEPLSMQELLEEVLGK